MTKTAVATEEPEDPRKRLVRLIRAQLKERQPMGRELVVFEVSATLSRHNSPEDEKDDEAWDDLKDKIIALTKEPKYQNIQPMTI